MCCLSTESGWRSALVSVTQDLTDLAPRRVSCRGSVRIGARWAGARLASCGWEARGVARAAANQGKARWPSAEPASTKLRALVVSAPEGLRERLRGHGRDGLVRACARLRPQQRSQPELYATSLALRSLARRVERSTREAAELEGELRRLVSELCPQLLALEGVGPISAAQVLVSFSHRGRFRSEAAFARLAGVPPIPASSGKSVRHRLDRGGDRRLNRALHTIVLTRRRSDAATIAYIARRVSEGKSERDAARCLKRYLARQLFRLLEATPAVA